MREWWRELQELRSCLEYPKVLHGPRRQKEFSYWPGCSWASVKMKVYSHLTVEIPWDFWGGIVLGQFAADKIPVYCLLPAQGLLEQDREPSLSLQWSPEWPQSEGGGQVTQVSWPWNGRWTIREAAHKQKPGKGSCPTSPIPVGVQTENEDIFYFSHVPHT